MSIPDLMGQLICDEMKIKGDIAFNTNSNIVKGFAEDFASARKIIRSLLGEDSIESFSKPVTHVNQWRFRSVNSKTHNLELWFNSGKLKGEDLLQQFHQVVMHCETAGVRVLGMVCDASGNNAACTSYWLGR